MNVAQQTISARSATRVKIEHAMQRVQGESWPEKGDVLAWLERLHEAAGCAGKRELDGIDRQLIEELP